MSKLTKEDKIEIYERRLKGETIPALAKTFNITESKIKYFIALIKKHGYNILRNGKNRIYSKEFKLQLSQGHTVQIWLSRVIPSNIINVGDGETIIVSAWYHSVLLIGYSDKSIVIIFYNSTFTSY